MSWRSLLYPNRHLCLSPNTDENRLNLDSPSNSIQRNDRHTNSFDICTSEALKQSEISLNLISNNNSRVDDVTHNISNTSSHCSPKHSTSSFHLHANQHPPKCDNKLAQIQDEMFHLKNKMKKFSKNTNTKYTPPPQRDSPKNVNTSFNKHMNVTSFERQNEFQTTDKCHPSHFDHLFRKQHNKESPQREQTTNANQDLNITNYEDLNLSQSNLQQNHDSFITQNDMQQISDFYQEHLLPNSHSNPLSKQDNPLQNHDILEQTSETDDNYTLSHQKDVNKHLEQLSANQERQLREETQNQLHTSNNEIIRLNQQLLDCQNKMKQSDQTISDETHSHSLPLSNRHLLQTNSQLQLDRNELLQALQNVLKEISQVSQKKRRWDSKSINEFRSNLNYFQSTKLVFKQQLHSLRSEFLSIGHIEPLNLSTQNEINKIYNSCQRETYDQSMIKQDSTLPNKYVKSPPLRSREHNLIIESTNQMTDNKGNKNNSFLKDSLNDNLNYSHTDVNSFYENLNETINHTKDIILPNKNIDQSLQNSSSLLIKQPPQQECLILNNLALDKLNSANRCPRFSNGVIDKNITAFDKDNINFRQSIPQPLDLSQKSIDLQQKIIQINNNKQKNNVNSLVQEYKQQQIDKQKCQPNSQTFNQFN